MTKRVISVALALLMVFSLSGCKKNEVEAYRDTLTPLIQDVQNMDQEVSDTVNAVLDAVNNQDEAAYKTSVEKLDGICKDLKDKYNAIANEAAPAEYAEDQKLLQQYADEMTKMLDASMEMYGMAYDYAVTGNLSDEDAARVTELQNEITQYADSTTKFDEVLNRVMGLSTSK